MIPKIFDEEYKKANFAYAQELAYEVVNKSGISSLPINIKKLLKLYKKSGLHVVTYSSFAKRRNLSMSEVIHFTDSEDGCLWKRSDDTYILLYNDTKTYRPTIRFTLAHELGHFLLKHHAKTSEEILSHRGLSKSTHTYLEMEANYFAKRLLAPIPLVDLYTKAWSKNDDEHLEKIFDISEPVSNSIIETLESRLQNTSIIFESHELVKNFKDFIDKDLSNKICSKCLTIQNNNCDFCKICGENSFFKPDFDNFIKFRDRKKTTMIYPKLKTDSVGRLTEACPNCKNEYLHDNYCQICGKQIINRCTGIQKLNDGTFTQTKACTIALEGDARYCPNCGANSTFLENGLLQAWDFVEFPF
ncbi:ImmA/IrrE family metallo-endopeptidase [Lactococcus nasutitermitis]|uniref:ImmA/IrrE family metallo-endopeptidase n=1 Tax=Lactococcus nasutitermitis TaxID=1652957 RepID=A0ABV9JH61_9LACT|nr:ImmA/IrrE family metallo-endopeptidase [Lactococcus nasutitermitis]